MTEQENKVETKTAPPEDDAEKLASSLGFNIDDLTMFIYPVSRKSYTSLRTFSRYRDIEQGKHLVLQKSKKTQNHPQFRIVTKVNPMFEIARGDNIVVMGGVAFRFAVALEESLDKNLPEKERVEKLLNKVKIIGEYNAKKTGQIDVMRSPSNLSTANSATPHAIRARGGKGATSVTTSRKIGDKKVKHVVSNFLESQNVAEYIVPFEGTVAYSLFFFFTFVPILVLRDASVENFRLALVIMYAVLAPIIMFGYPKSIGIVIFGHREDVKNNITNFYEALYVLSKRGERKIEYDDDDDEYEYDDDDDDDGDVEDVASSAKPSTTAVIENNKKVAPFSKHGLLPVRTVKAAVDSSQSNVFSDIVGQSFQVRCGPNYKKNKQKAFSRESLFYLAGVDIYTCQKRVSHLGQYFDLQQLHSREAAPIVLNEKSPIDSNYLNLRRQMDDSSANRNLQLQPNETFVAPKTADGFTLGTMEKPLIFIAVFQLPTYGPGTFTAITDGPGLSVIQYFIATPETQRDLLRQNPTMPAVRLLRDMLLATPGSEESKKQLDRMKCIPRLVNEDELETPWLVRSAVKSYNAKPFLTRPQHSVFRGPGYFEFDLDVHAFCLAARKVLDSFISRFGDVVLDWAYTVEAYDDDEQPECVLGGFRLYRCDMVNRPSWEASLEAFQTAKAQGTIPDAGSPQLSSASTASDSPRSSGENEADPLSVPEGDALSSIGHEKDLSRLQTQSPSEKRTSLMLNTSKSMPGATPSHAPVHNASTSRATTSTAQQSSYQTHSSQVQSHT